MQQLISSYKAVFSEMLDHFLILMLVSKKIYVL
jgi:hypothetical protein